MSVVVKPSICISAICFTLNGKDPSHNEYIQIFLMWLNHLSINGGLTASDILYIFTDNDTRTFLEDYTVFPSTCEEVGCVVKVITLSKPNTLLEGMMWKYTNLDIVQDIFIYCDIDVLINGSLHHLCDDLAKDTIYVHHEGTMGNSDYNAAFTENDSHLFKLTDPGISAGKFIITSQVLREKLFVKINELIAKHTGEEFYTIEQPFFNKACKLLSLDGEKINLTTINPPIVSMNRHYYDKDRTIFMDFAGQPGDGLFHLDKMWGALDPC